MKIDLPQLYKTAHDAYFVEKDFDKAISLFNEVTTQFPDSTEAQYARKLIQQINLDKNGKFTPENQLLDNKANPIAKFIYYIQKNIKFKKIFLVWILLHLFMLVHVITWKTDYHHLEKNTFTIAGLIAINLPISLAIYYPVDKFNLLQNTPAPGLNPWARPKESDMKFIKLKWSMAILIFMIAGYAQWLILSFIYTKTKKGFQR